MKLLITQFLQSLATPFAFSRNVLLSTVFSNTLGLSTASLSEIKFHTRKKPIGQIIGLNISLGTRRVDKGYTFHRLFLFLWVEF
jgi:hypothetical protein